METRTRLKWEKEKTVEKKTKQNPKILDWQVFSHIQLNKIY